MLDLVRLSLSVFKIARTSAHMPLICHVRIMRDQRAKRFDSRRTLHLESQGLSNFAKVPADTARFDFGVGTLQNAAAMLPPSTDSATASMAPGTGVMEPTVPEDDDLDLDGLGLDKGQPKGKAKAKLKRTQAQVKQDEVNKIRSELNHLVECCGHLPGQPKVSDLARVERMVSKRIRDLKESHDFDLANDAQNIANELECLKAAVKPCQAYMLGSAPTRRKHGQDRYVSLGFSGYIMAI